MKRFRLPILLMLLAAFAPSVSVAADLGDLLSPDDVMLRKPAGTSPRVEPAGGSAADAAAAQAAEEARIKAELDRKAAEAIAAREAAAKKAAEDARAKAERERKAAEEAVAREAAAKKAAEEALAKSEAAAKKKAEDDARARAERERKAAEELKSLREQVAAERAAREKAEAGKKAAEDGRAKAERERKAAEAATAAAVEAKNEAEAAVGEVVKKVRDEKSARQRAEAAAAAAEARAVVEKRAAEKAVADKVAMERRVDYLMNPDPDERKSAAPGKLAPGGSNDVDVTELPAKGGEEARTPPPKKALTGRAAVITAARTDYDRKEGVILFDRNVYVDDEQYQMHADRLFVFLDGTNELKRLVAIGHVAITNEEKRASCSRAVYTKSVSKIVMYGDASEKACLEEVTRRGDNVVRGDRITFWLNSEQVEIEGPAVSMPGGAMKGGSGKDFLNQLKGQ